jgi:hypothetical protein
VEQHLAFQTPITIASAVREVHEKHYLLPAIQREFVWSTTQIEELFDSLLRGYPIGSFLFWRVDRTHRREYQFYEFIRDYHQRDGSHNERADVDIADELTAVLDGQQRLTALYIGLRGSHASRIKGKWWNNPGAFPRKRLYLDLLKEADDWDGGYTFRFLTDNEAKATDPSSHWFPVGEILDFDGLKDVNRYLISNQILDNEFASDTLIELYETIHSKLLVNYFLELDQDLDKVLNIFIRVNKGGTPLSYSDLLLSVATAQWKKLDARQEINELVDELNQLSSVGFNFDKDFVLKACLVVAGIPDIRFTVTNFNQANMSMIESRWSEIRDALTMAVSLVGSFGFNGQTLTSNNSVIPIAYYLLLRGLPSSYIQGAAHIEDRRTVRRWLLATLLKGVYGDQADTLLSAIRNIIDESHDAFPMAELETRLVRMNKSVRFEPEEIDGLLHGRYGQRQTFATLALLYPSLDYRQQFHQDHIVPRSLFTRQIMRKRGLSDDLQEFARDRYNDLPNLQMLEGMPNLEKSNKDFEAWLRHAYPTVEDQAAYRERHYIPPAPATLEDFRDFYEARAELLRTRLTAALPT